MLLKFFLLSLNSNLLQSYCQWIQIISAIAINLFIQVEKLAGLRWTHHAALDSSVGSIQQTSIYQFVARDYRSGAETQGPMLDTRHSILDSDIDIDTCRASGYAVVTGDSILFD